MNDTEKAYEANGKLRSELARYKTAHDKQQRRIRELAGFIASIAFDLNGNNFDRAVEIAKAHGLTVTNPRSLKGAKS